MLIVFRMRVPVQTTVDLPVNILVNVDGGFRNQGIRRIGLGVPTEVLLNKLPASNLLQKFSDKGLNNIVLGNNEQSVQVYLDSTYPRGSWKYGNFLYSLNLFEAQSN